MRMRLKCLLAACIAVAPFAAQAQETGGAALFVSPMGMPHRAATAGEALTAWFNAADADQDGALTREEFLAAELPFHGMIDRNKDGLVTPIESANLFRATAPELFAPLPALRGARARMPPDPGRLTQPRDRSNDQDQRLRGAARFGLLSEVEPVMSCDADMSRWVTAAEFRACAERRFTLLDADGDGLFRLDESVRARAILAGADPDEER